MEVFIPDTDGYWIQHGSIGEYRCTVEVRRYDDDYIFHLRSHNRDIMNIGKSIIRSAKMRYGKEAIMSLSSHHMSFGVDVETEDQLRYVINDTYNALGGVSSLVLAQ